MSILRDLRASYDEELRSLIREVDGMALLNRPISFEDMSRYRAIATSMLAARFRLDDAIRQQSAPYLGIDPELVDLRQFFTRAALEASHGARA